MGGGDGGGGDPHLPTCVPALECVSGKDLSEIFTYCNNEIETAIQTSLLIQLHCDTWPTSTSTDSIVLGVW